MTASGSPGSPVGTPRTVVLGLGNPVRRDDGVGLAVAGAVRRLLADAPLPGVHVTTAERAGFEIIDLLRGSELAVLVDCLDVPSPRPGRVRRLVVDGVAGAPRLVDAHGLSLPNAFQLAACLGIPMPAEVEILGVEPGDTLTLGEGLTPPVRSAVAPLARAIHARLAARAARPSRPPSPPNPP